MSTIPKDVCPYCESTNYYQEIYMECINCGHKEKINSSGLESHIKGIGNSWDANLVNNLQSRIDELISWKERAMEVMSPLQEIGKAMNVKLGESIHDKILPYIKELKKDRDWFMEAHDYLLKEAAEYSTKSEKTIIDLESAFAGAEEMVKDKIKKISELEKENELLRVENVVRLNRIAVLNSDNEKLQTSLKEKEKECEELAAQTLYLNEHIDWLVSCTDKEEETAAKQIEELKAENERLKEKAWMYDSLNK